MQQVVAHYDLLQELQIAIPPMEFAAFKTLEGDMLLMQDAAYSAEANKELYIQKFKVRWVAVSALLSTRHVE